MQKVFLGSDLQGAVRRGKMWGPRTKVAQRPGEGKQGLLRTQYGDAGQHSPDSEEEPWSMAGKGPQEGLGATRGPCLPRHWVALAPLGSLSSSTRNPQYPSSFIPPHSWPPPPGGDRSPTGHSGQMGPGHLGSRWEDGPACSWLGSQACSLPDMRPPPHSAPPPSGSVPLPSATASFCPLACPSCGSPGPASGSLSLADALRSPPGYRLGACFPSEKPRPGPTSAQTGRPQVPQPCHQVRLPWMPSGQSPAGSCAFPGDPDGFPRSQSLRGDFCVNALLEEVKFQGPNHSERGGQSVRGK